jgi:hypothetical protein
LAGHNEENIVTLYLAIYKNQFKISNSIVANNASTFLEENTNEFFMDSG